MDPNACLREILAALETGDRETAIERLRDLADWLQAGGVVNNGGHESANVIRQHAACLIRHEIDFARRDKP
jgi:hypothetical protein